MADTPLTGFVSAFDELLKRNRRRMQERIPKAPGRAMTNRARGPERVFPEFFVPRTPAAAPSTPDPIQPLAEPRPTRTAASEGERRLNERFGDGWQYEVMERSREGDEVIVLCRVTVPGKNISKEQFGRASIRLPGRRDLVRGSANGIAFAMRLESERSRVPAGNPEEAAFQTAVENALARCADLI